MGNSISLNVPEKTGTFQDLWPHLSESEKKNIAEVAIRYLRDTRFIQYKTCRSADAVVLPRNRLEGFNGGEVSLPPTFSEPGRESNRIIQPCDTLDEIWDRVYEPPLLVSGVPEDLRAFLRKTMPQDKSFCLTPMDLSSSNIRVRNGEFSFLNSAENIAYTPSFFLNAGIDEMCLSTGRRIESRTKTGKEDTTLDGDLAWCNQLISWMKEKDNLCSDFGSNIFGIFREDGRGAEYGTLWFKYWRLIQLEDYRNDPATKSRRRYIEAVWEGMQGF